MVTIRLARGGAKKRPFFGIMVADQRRSPRGRFIERVGFFNPRALGGEDRLRIDTERVNYWISKGAQPSERVAALMKQFAKGPEVMEAEQAKREAVIAATKAQAAKAEADAAKAAEKVEAEAAKVEAEAAEAAKVEEATAEEATAEEATAEEATAEEATAEEPAAEEATAEEATAEEATAEEATAEEATAEEATAEEPAADEGDKKETE